MTRMGRTPTLVLCSRNARPEKGLVRRPHVDQHGCPPKRGNTSELGGSLYIVRRAQEARSATPLKRGILAPDMERRGLGDGSHEGHKTGFSGSSASLRSTNEINETNQHTD